MGEILKTLDLFATLADVVDRKLPDEAAQDSFSILSVLQGKADEIVGREEIFILGNGRDSEVAVFTSGDSTPRGTVAIRLSAVAPAGLAAQFFIVQFPLDCEFLSGSDMLV